MTKEQKLIRIHRFSEFQGINDIKLTSHKLPIENNMPLDPLLCEIFAPDPRTNLPHSDLHVIMSRDSRPEVAQFIRDTLMQPLGDGIRSDNEDDAIEMVKGHNESFIDYAERLRAFVEKTNAKSDKNE